MKVVSIFLIFICSVLCENYTCDFSFGDPSWNYSKLFYNEKHLIPPKTAHFNVTLPHEKNQMISFVCVNLTAVDLSKIKVSFASLFRRVNIDFLYPVHHDVLAYILALGHGF